MLGLFEHAQFEEETLTLEPGDLIVVFSDGVTEAMNAESEEFTDDRLLACANDHLGETPQQVLDALLADVHDVLRRRNAERRRHRRHGAVQRLAD